MQYFEREFERFSDLFLNHPISLIINNGALPADYLQEFAKIQFVDSILWVPMLSLLKERATHGRLIKAMMDNLACEAGIHGRAHTDLCREFVISTGAKAYYGDIQDYSPHSKMSIRFLNALINMPEMMVAGAMLAQEALVPELFKLFRPAYVHLGERGLRYLDDHIEVDSLEHAKWMLDAVAEMDAVEPGGLNLAQEGFLLAARNLLTVPDALYAELLIEGALS